MLQELLATFVEACCNLLPRNDLLRKLEYRRLNK
jgi:hypothetical protein